MPRTSRLLVAAVLGAVLAMLVAQSSGAAIGKFRRIGSAEIVSADAATAQTSSSATGGALLRFPFTEQGVGSLATIHYRATLATYTVLVACVNDGNNTTSDTKKFLTSSDVAATDSSTADANGKVVATFEGSLPTFEDQLTCPPGQTSQALTATATGIVIHDLDNGSSAPVGDASGVLFQTR